MTDIVTNRGRTERRPDYIRFVRRVTRRHAAIFRDVMRERWSHYGELSYALEQTGIMEWPDGDSYDETPAQVRCQELEQEIFDRMFLIAEDALVAAFTTAAAQVIEREHVKVRRKAQPSDREA